MTKYYVRSGNFSIVILAKDSTEAIDKAFRNKLSNKHSLCLIGTVSEHGFESIHKEDMLFYVPDVLHRLGLMKEEEKQKIENWLNSRS